MRTPSRPIPSTGKPLVLSTGVANEAEIQEAVTTAREAGCKDLVLLHCISAYPAPMDQANLRQMPELARRFGTVAGLSDHTLGTTASVTAIALGACLIDKHFTLSRADKGSDSEFSLEPADFERLCRDAKDAWLALGRAGLERQNVEAGSKVFWRSIYFVRDLPAGAIIGPEDIRRIRPGNRSSPKHFEQLIYLRSTRDIACSTPVRWGSFDASS